MEEAVKMVIREVEMTMPCKMLSFYSMRSNSFAWKTSIKEKSNSLKSFYTDWREPDGCSKGPRTGGYSRGSTAACFQAV